MGRYHRESDGPVWQIAKAQGRDYITPEDVGEAIKAGHDRRAIAVDILVAVDSKAFEDASLCAFTLLNRLRTTKTGTPLL